MFLFVSFCIRIIKILYVHGYTEMYTYKIFWKYHVGAARPVATCPSCYMKLFYALFYYVNGYDDEINK